MEGTELNGLSSFILPHWSEFSFFCITSAVIFRYQSETKWAFGLFWWLRAGFPLQMCAKLKRCFQNIDTTPLWNDSASTKRKTRFLLSRKAWTFCILEGPFATTLVVIVANQHRCVMGKGTPLIGGRCHLWVITGKNCRSKKLSRSTFD